MAETNALCRFCAQPIKLVDYVGWVHSGEPWYAMCGTFIDDDGNESGGQQARPGVLRLRVSDVAREYGFNERYVRHLVAERRIPFYKVGALVVFDRAELDKWFAEQRVEVES